MKFSHEKETALSVFEFSTDNSNEENGIETEKCNHERKHFEGIASGSGPSKAKTGWRDF